MGRGESEGEGGREGSRVKRESIYFVISFPGVFQLHRVHQHLSQQDITEGLT